MLTLAQYKKKNKKREVRVCVTTRTYWDYSIDDAIKELREIKKANKPHKVEMELEREYGYYSDDYPALSFYIRRQETNDEYDKRMQREYENYVRQEEYKLKIYEEMKAKLEK